MSPDLVKTCSRCRETKPLAEFAKNASRADGRTQYCRPCHNAKRREYGARPAAKSAQAEYDGSPERLNYRRAYARTEGGRRAAWKAQLRTYGLDLVRWDALLLAHSGRCGGCAEALRGDRHTHIDHDHATGRVRGLLCSGCNHALGGARDNPRTLRALALYLETT